MGLNPQWPNQRAWLACPRRAMTSLTRCRLLFAMELAVQDGVILYNETLLINVGRGLVAG
jgi:hypothetical protein